MIIERHVNRLEVMDPLFTAKIYSGGYVPDLFIVAEGESAGWLAYRHPDGQLVTLCDLKPHVNALAEFRCGRIRTITLANGKTEILP